MHADSFYLLIFIQGNWVKKYVLLVFGIFLSLSLYGQVQNWTVIDNDENALSGYRVPGTKWKSVKNKGYTIHVKGILTRNRSTLIAYAWHPKRNIWIQLPMLRIRTAPKIVDSKTVYQWKQDLEVPNWAWIRGHKGGRANLQLRIGNSSIPPLNPYGNSVMPDCESFGNINSPCTLTVYTANHIAEYTGLGYLDGRFEDWNSNTCVNGVESQFAQLNSLPRDADGFILPTGTTTFNPKVGTIVSGFGEPIKDFTISKNHVQGFSRIPSLHNSQLMVFTRSNRESEGGPSGLLIVKMNKNELTTDGEAFFRTIKVSNDDVTRTENRPIKDFVINRELENPPKVSAGIKPNSTQTLDSEVIYMKEIPGTYHPGGIQVMGNIIAVPSWCSKAGLKADICNNAIISFYKISSSTRTPGIAVRLINRFERGQKGWDNPINRRIISSNKANFMAMTRMSNGHYIIFINRSDDGHTDIFVSESKIMNPSMGWQRLDLDKYQKNYDNSYEGPSDTYQNFNFVTDCNSGKIYAIGLSQESKNENQIDLFIANKEGRSKMDLDRLKRIRFSTSQIPNSESGCCEMKGGAGIYVTPSGRLVIYCMQKHHRQGDSQNQFYIAEFVRY